MRVSRRNLPPGRKALQPRPPGPPRDPLIRRFATPGEPFKVILANRTMIDAFRNGLPAAGKTFPEGSKVVKIEWSQKQNPVSPYFVMVPDTLESVSFIEKDSKRFPTTHGWAYAQFLYDPVTGSLKPNGTGAECGYACHTAVSAQDYIFTAYPPR